MMEKMRIMDEIRRRKVCPEWIKGFLSSSRLSPLVRLAQNEEGFGNQVFFSTQYFRGTEKALHRQMHWQLIPENPKVKILFFSAYLLAQRIP